MRVVVFRIKRFLAQTTRHLRQVGLALSGDTDRVVACCGQHAVEFRFVENEQVDDVVGVAVAPQIHAFAAQFDARFGPVNAGRPHRVVGGAREGVGVSVVFTKEQQDVVAGLQPIQVRGNTDGTADTHRDGGARRDCVGGTGVHVNVVVGVLDDTFGQVVGPRAADGALHHGRQVGAGRPVVKQRRRKPGGTEGQVGDPDLFVPHILVPGRGAHSGRSRGIWHGVGLRSAAQECCDYQRGGGYPPGVCRCAHGKSPSGSWAAPTLRHIHTFRSIHCELLGEYLYRYTIKVPHAAHSAP